MFENLPAATPPAPERAPRALPPCCPCCGYDLKIFEGSRAGRPRFCPGCGGSPLSGGSPDDGLRAPDSTMTELILGPSSQFPVEFGKFLILGVLGHGGMGVVFEAGDRLRGERVALKILDPHRQGSRDMRARFRRERQIGRRISHPRCIRTIAGGKVGRHRYLVLELAPRGSLLDLVQRAGRLPPGEAVERVLELLEALEHLHAMGIVHRDVKPSNCLLDAEGRVKLGDFGCARDLKAEPLTQFPSFVGTQRFSAPEQADGAPPDPRIDTYAAAATLRFLLEEPPGTRTGSTRLVSPAPAFEGAAGGVATLPSRLDEALERGLDPRPQCRWQTAREFAEGLREAVGAGDLRR